MRWWARLRRSSEIAFVRRRGRRAVAATLVAYATRGAAGADCLAITVSKAVGPAVVRNLVRRRIRGSLESLSPPPVALRLILVAKPAAATEPYGRLAADVAQILAELGRP